MKYTLCSVAWCNFSCVVQCGVVLRCVVAWLGIVYCCVGLCNVMRCSVVWVV